MRSLIVVALVTVLSVCEGQFLGGNGGRPKKPIGSARDEHGCIPSAGYSWCASKNKCHRPWEEACPPMMGSDKDQHGCKGSAGFTWCDAKQKCLQPWVEDCPEADKKTTVKTVGNVGRGIKLGGDQDANGCKGSAGFRWCEAKQKCLQPWMESCPSTAAAEKKEPTAERCVANAGFSWCETKQKCIQVSKGESCPMLGQRPEDAPKTGPKSCLSSAGYSWCDSKKKCLKPWMEDCPIAYPGTDKDEKLKQDVNIVNAEPGIVIPENQQKVGNLGIVEEPGIKMPTKVDDVNKDLQQEPGIVEPWKVDPNFGKKAKKIAQQKAAKKVNPSTQQDHECLTMIEGMAFCPETQSCIMKTECDSIQMKKHQVRQHANRCMSEIVGQVWCEKAGRCMDGKECDKL